MCTLYVSKSKFDVRNSGISFASIDVITSLCLSDEQTLRELHFLTLQAM